MNVCLLIFFKDTMFHDTLYSIEMCISVCLNVCVCMCDVMCISVHKKKTNQKIV